MTTLEECSALVSEVKMAQRLAPKGAELSGADLLYWRELPQKEQAYFRALLAPQFDARTDPCNCGRPVHYTWLCGHVRCVRCLRAWSIREERLGTLPMISDLRKIERTDIGYALEHALPVMLSSEARGPA